MGLKIICYNETRSIGTYHEVELLKKNLINSCILFLDTDILETDDIICYMNEFIDEEGINYRNYSLELNNKLKLFGLEGIVIFIMKNDNNNVMSVGEAMDFMFSLDLIKKYIDIKYFIKDEKIIENFYLFSILMKAIKNFKVLEFY